ncbi:MAG TPA: winged helix DNA-binding domain-containing protein [Jiangellaceae bacterium]
MADAGRAQILAFRLASHNLTDRLEVASVVDATAACGVQETPTGSAALALLARVEGLTPAGLRRALTNTRNLVTLWSVRGAPYVVPASDVDVFSVGALPVDAASFRQSLGGWAAALDRAGLDPFDTLDQMIEVARNVLDGRTLDVNDLRDQIYARMPSLSTVQRPSGAHADMPEPLFRAVGTAGAVCIVAGRGTDAELARTDQWLSWTRSQPDRTAARAELTRRFLHCYGPATAQQFAQWSLRSLSDADDAFSLIEEELTELTVNGTHAWLLARDEQAFCSPPQPDGTRLLPVQDPFLQQRDRATLVQDEPARRKLWRPVRGPGGVLAGGQIVGTWRIRAKGSRLEVSVEPFGALSPPTRDAIEAEAQRIAPFRDDRAVEAHYVT